MNYIGSNHKTAAAWNRGSALRLLRRHGVLSRNDVSRMTGLQGSTLSYIMRELLEKNVVRVVGKRESRQVGQKQVLLTINPELGWMLGISLRPEGATFVMLDAAGGRIDALQSPLVGKLEDVPEQLHTALQKWLGKRGTPSGKLLGLGVGVPGVVDADAGVVLRSNSMASVNVPLQQLLTDTFAVTTVIDHDACFGACAEATDGAAADASHFIYFSVNLLPAAAGASLNAYGSALFLNGSIYRGAFYGAGELTKSLAPDPLDLTHEEVALLTEPAGDMPPVLQDLALRIGNALSPMINLVDVQQVVLAGTARIANQKFIAAVQSAVTAGLVSIPGRAVRVVKGQWELEAVARGAAIGAFDELVKRGELFASTDEKPVGAMLRPVLR